MARKPLLIVGILGFFIANSVTALSTDLTLSLVARFVAGAFSGLIWEMLAGYARRIVRPEHAGRALAIAMTGTPIALALGTPLGSWLGTTFDWRWSFWAMSILALITVALAALVVPDAAGQRAATRIPLKGVLGISGVSVILVVVFAWMLAHNIVYTYVASYLRAAGVGLPVDLALVIFGAAALIGIWITGVVVDRSLRGLVLISILLFVAAGVIFVVAQDSLVAVLIAIALWGIAFGGAATQLQTAMGEASAENADVANALLTVSFNLAIFAGGVFGAVLIDTHDGLVLPIVMIALALAALIVVLASRRSAFPVGR